MERKPILLSKNTCALILIFDRTDEMFDVIAGAYEDFDSHETWEKSAKEFVSQLNDRWSISFMESLKNEIHEILAEHARAIYEKHEDK